MTRVVKFWCIAVLCLWTASGHAATDAVALVLSDSGAPYQDFVRQFRSNLEAANGGIRISVLSSVKLAAKSDAIAPDVDVVIPVGVHATEVTLQAGTAVPVLATLVPKAAYAGLKKTAAGRDLAFSAIYLDQPFSRRFALINDALPGRKKVGVVLGPESAGDLRALQTAAREKGFTLVSERIADADDLLPALKRVLSDSDVLLAVPDPIVFNKATAQSILLTSYRAQNPLVGYSQSYVHAGALLAVYSTPAQIGQQAAELVLQLPHNSPVTLPPPQYPKYFSVSVNAQVARSMGITIEPENVLLERLVGAGGRE